MIPKDFTSGSVFDFGELGNLIILEYINSRCVRIMFEDTGHTKTAQAGDIRRKKVKDPMRPKFYGVGFIGSERAKTTHPSYRRWLNMLERCYSDTFHEKQPKYSDCFVCEEWHNFQNFSKWYDDNYPNDGKKYHLDKDIKIKGNKCYSPETCMFVTPEENNEHATAIDFTLTSPDGKVYRGRNVRSFCRRMGLNQGAISNLLNGRAKSHKGWTVST